MQFFNVHGIESFIPMLNEKPLFNTLIFIKCTESFVFSIMEDYSRQVYVYRDPEQKKPQAIPTNEMDNFIMVLNIVNQEYIPLKIYDKSFLKGQRVKVLEGPLKGAVGIVKRIKGDRRLIVSVSGIAVIATSFIPPQWLEVEK